MLYAHVVCPCLCFISMSISVLHVLLNGACPMLHVQVHSTCIWTCSMDLDMQNGLRQAAWTWTCSIDMDTQHGHGLAAWTLTSAYAVTCCLSMFPSRIHIHVHAACLCPCLCYMFMSMLHVHVNSACSSPCTTDLDMQRGPWHAAWT